MKKITLIALIVLSITMLAGCGEKEGSGIEFSGTKGDPVSISDDKVLIAASEVSDGDAHYFNTEMPDGETVFYFVVKSPDGKIRAAANGCQVCGAALQGFHQEEDFMVCNTCGNSYPLDKIATEKGGCNPAPINPDLQIVDGNVSISISELKDIQQFFI